MNQIEVFLVAEGMSASEFGRRAVQDDRLIARLRRGGDVTTDTMDRVRSFMVAHAEAAALDGVDGDCAA